MLPIEHALKIMGAAEGSWFVNTYTKKWVDLRYTPVFASPKSGLSFGVYQHDTHSNLQALNAFIAMLSYALASQLIDEKQKRDFLSKARKAGSGLYFCAADKKLLTKILSLSFSKTQVDKLDQQRAFDFQKNKVDPIVVNALRHWQIIEVKNPALKLDLGIFTEGKKEYGCFYAYLMASLNKRETSDQIYRKWLAEEPIPLKSGEIKKLDHVPTIDDVHSFLSSLQIWQGDNGNYNELRKRLDPVLDELGY